VSAQTLIAECEKYGVTVHLDGGALKLRGAPAAVKAAANRLRPHKAAIVVYLGTHPTAVKIKQSDTDLLDRFILDDCANDPEPELINRINNITFRLVTMNGWEFSEAMTAAAVWVVNNPRHHDEEHFIDVMNLWKFVRSPIISSHAKNKTE